jgi:ABC-type transport system involved in multi-copper enzyme maturation permease subunit
MTFFRLLKFEVRKLFKQKSARAAFIIVIVISAVFFLVNFVNRPEGTYTGLDLIVETVNIQNSVLFVLPLVGILLAVQSLSEELSTGTIKTLLTRPVKRENILFCKFLALYAYIISISYTVLIITLLLGLRWGYPEMEASLLPPLLLMVFWHSLGIMVLVAFTFLVASLGTAPVTAAIISLGIHRLFIILEYFPQIQKFTFSHRVTTLIQNSIQTLLGQSLDLRQLWESLTIILIYMLVILLIASFLIERRDISR